MNRFVTQNLHLFCWCFPWETVFYNLSARNIGHLLLLLLLFCLVSVFVFCQYCLFVLSALWHLTLSCSICWSFGFVLDVLTCWCKWLISISCSALSLVSVLVPCNICAYLRLVFVTRTAGLVFFVPTSSQFTLPFCSFSLKYIHINCCNFQ